jgi:hypothetical protein
MTEDNSPYYFEVTRYYLNKLQIQCFRCHLLFKINRCFFYNILRLKSNFPYYHMLIQCCIRERRNQHYFYLWFFIQSKGFFCSNLVLSHNYLYCPKLNLSKFITFQVLLHFVKHLIIYLFLFPIAISLFSNKIISILILILLAILSIFNEYIYYFGEVK